MQRELNLEDLDEKGSPLKISHMIILLLLVCEKYSQQKVDDRGLVVRITNRNLERFSLSSREIFPQYNFLPNAMQFLEILRESRVIDYSLSQRTTDILFQRELKRPKKESVAYIVERLRESKTKHIRI
jgi:hypothetical protein